MEFDEGFLREVGLSAMPENQKQAFLEYAEEELEVRIGEKISAGIQPEKLREFEGLEGEEAVNWLKENKPNFVEIVDETISELKREISENRERILN